MTLNLSSKLKASFFPMALCLLLFGLGFLPLMSAFSYEAAFGTALLGLIVIPLGIRWLFLQPALPVDVRKTFLSAHLSALMFFCIAIGMALLSALRAGEICNLSEGFKYFFALTLPSNILVAGLCFALRTHFHDAARRATAAYIALVLAAFAWTLWKLYDGPAIVAFGPFYGYFAGSIYDESIDVMPALIKYRLGTALLYAGLVLPFFLKIVPKVRLSLLLLLCTSSILWTHFLAQNGDTIQEGRDSLRSDLWMQVEDGPADLPSAKARPAMRLHFVPSSKDRDAIAVEGDALLQDALADYRHLNNFFQSQYDETLDIWLYPNPILKARHMGAQNTSIARVWKNELHLPVSPRRSSLLRHEMAHIFAGSFAYKPLMLAGLPLIPNMGWVEGLAMAAEWPKTPYNLHQWSAAILAPAGLDYMQISGRELMDGFWLLPSRVAYTLAGSYVRWLIDTYGIEKVKELSKSRYAAFPKILGLSFEDSFELWKETLMAKELKPKALLRVALAFDTSSLFSRKCARQNARQRVDLSKCLSNESCGTESLIAYCPAQDVSELENLWLVYLHRGPLSSLKTKNDTNFVEASAKAQRQKLAILLLKAQETQRLSLRLKALWAEHVVDLFWHANRRALAQLSAWVLSHAALMPDQERRLALKTWALHLDKPQISHSLRAYFAASTSEESLKVLAKAPASSVIFYLRTVNALGERDFDNAAYNLARLIIAAASSTQSPLPDKVMRQIPKLAAELSVNP